MLVGRGSVFVVRSLTRKWPHVVVHLDDDRWLCSCEARVTCKHINEAAAEEKDGKPLAQNVIQIDRARRG